MDTYRDQARETDYDLRYRRFNDAPSDSPPLPGPCDRVRRDTLLPLYPRSQEPQPQRGKQCYPPRESQNLSQILSQLDDRVTSIARVLEFGLCLIWRHLYLVGLWHGFDVVMVLGFVYGLPYWRIVDYHARHWRRHWVLSILLYGLLFCSANLEYHLRYTRAAMKPPAYGIVCSSFLVIRNADVYLRCLPPRLPSYLHGRNLSRDPPRPSSYLPTPP
jgi:hypothetical protein